MANEVDDWIAPPEQQPATSQQAADDWIASSAENRPEAKNERYQLWPERLARGLYSAAKSAFTLPGDVYAGRVDPLSEEGIGRAAEASFLLTPAAPGTASMAALPAAREAIEAGARQGIEIPRFMAGETELMPRMAEGLRNVPFSGEPIAQSARTVGQQIGEAVSKVAPVTEPAIAGEAARSGLLRGITKARPVGDAYRGVDDFLANPNATVQLTNAAKEANRIIAEREAARLPESGAVKTLENALTDPTGLNYHGIKNLRTYLGERTPNELVAEGINPREAKRLYGPLTEDLRNAVHAAGGQEALDAWESANALAKQSAQQRRQLYKIVGAKGEASPELVFSRLQAMAGSKSSADIGRLQVAKQNMGQEAWQQFSSGIVSKLGRDPLGNFSADRFVTGYANLSPGARNVIFSDAQRQSLNDLFKVSQLVRDKITRFSNVSRSAGTLLGAGELFGLWHEPISTIGSIVGGRAVSWYLTQPAVAKAASNVGRTVLRNDPIAHQQALGALRRAIASVAAQRREQGVRPLW